MKIGTTTIPFLPLAAVVLAMVLVVLVLWGVRRARRHPAPAAVPGARPARAAAPVQQPCAADWTGEVANGYATPPVPAQRPRTVADIVAERDADTSPLPVVAAAAPPVPASRTGAHALRPDTEVAPVPAPADDAPAAPGTAQDATPSDAAAEPTTPGPAPPEGAAATEDPRRDVAAPSDERPDTATLAALHTPSGDAPGSPQQQAAPDVVAETGETLPDTAHDTAHDEVPPPWSAARSEPAGTGLEPSDDDPDQAADPAAGAGEGDIAAVPVSRAVQQALAARAVQRARRHRDDGGPDDASPVAEPAEASEASEPSREHPLTIVPSAAPPPAAADPRDRLLSVLLADPARAVGATEDLDGARDRIDQLGDVLRRRRADLAAAVRRLHDSGLDRDQIGRLAGMGCDDVAEILEARTGDGADGPRPT